MSPYSGDTACTCQIRSYSHLRSEIAGGTLTCATHTRTEDIYLRQLFQQLWASPTHVRLWVLGFFSKAAPVQGLEGPLNY